MNLLEQYIIEVYSVEEKKYNWDGKEVTLIEVDLKTNCYGIEQRTTKSFYSMEKWEEVKMKGYYMA